MPNWVKSLLLSFTVAFVAGFLLRLIGAGEQAGFIGGILGVVVFGITSMLSGNRSVRNLSSGDREEALAATPQAGFGHVFVSRSGFMAMAVGFDVKIDGVPLAQLKSPRFTRLVLPAGEHTLTAGPSGFAGTQSKESTLKIQVRSGERLFFELKNRLGMVKSQVEIVPRPPAEIASLRSITMVAAQPVPNQPTVL